MCNVTSGARRPAHPSAYVRPEGPHNAELALQSRGPHKCMQRKFIACKRRDGCYGSKMSVSGTASPWTPICAANFGLAKVEASLSLYVVVRLCNSASRRRSVASAGSCHNAAARGTNVHGHAKALTQQNRSAHARNQATFEPRCLRSRPRMGVRRRRSPRARIVGGEPRPSCSGKLFATWPARGGERSCCDASCASDRISSVPARVPSLRPPGLWRPCGLLRPRGLRRP